jgi:hypothetical protein
MVLEACSEALPEAGNCVVSARSPDATASVEWLDATYTQAWIRVVRGEASHERTLRFSEVDPLSERLRAIGFALATLVPERAVAKPKSVGLPEKTAAPPPVPPRDHVALGLVAGGYTGVAGKFFPGAEARVAVPLRRLEITAAGGLTIERSEGPHADSSLVWISGGARTALWSSVQGRAFVRGEAFAERLHVEVYTADVALHGYRWLPGVRAGIDAEIAAFGRAFVAASAGVGVRAGKTDIIAVGNQTAPLGYFRTEASLGLGTRF